VFRISFFEDIKITHKLVVLFSAMLLGFIALSIAYWLVVKNSKEASKRSSVFVEYEQLVSEAQKNYFKVRRYEKDFLLGISASIGRTYNEAPLDEHKKFMKSLEAAMVKLTELAPLVDIYTQKVTTDEDNVDVENYIESLVSQASEVTSNYEQSFEDIVKFNRAVGFAETDGLRNQINRRAKQIESGINKLKNAVLFGSLSTIRAKERYILRSIDLTEAYEDLKNESKKFKFNLRLSNLPVDEKITVITLADDYVAGINLIVANKRRANENTELYDFMLGPIFEEMGQSAQIRIASNQIVQLENTSKITSIFTGAFVGVAVLLSLILLLFGRSLVKPIQALQSTIHQVNDGRIDVRSRMKRNDELGELSNAFDQLLDERVAQLSKSEAENYRLNESIVELLKSVAQLSKKDFTTRVPVFENVTGAVADSLNLLAKETGDALGEVRNISVKVAKVSSQVKDRSDLVMSLAHKERKQAKTAMNELKIASCAMQKISKDSQEANYQANNALENTQIALDTVNQSIRGINGIRDTISETEKRIKRLGERSQEITGIVNLINNIAERTHILALNASMHAASAGEAGHGFAVVADQVQRLAENAREATKEIGILVNNIRVETSDTVSAMNNAITQVAQGTELAEQAGNAMLMTQASTKDLVQAVEVIARSSRSQAKASVALLDRAKEIVDSTQQTDKHLKQQSVNTDLLGRYSKNLVETVGVFKLPGDEEQRPVLETTRFEELEKELDMSEAASS